MAYCALLTALTASQEYIRYNLEVGTVSEFAAGLTVLEIPDDAFGGLTGCHLRLYSVSLFKGGKAVARPLNIEDRYPEVRVLEQCFDIIVRCVEGAEIGLVAGAELEVTPDTVTEQFTLHPFTRLELVKHIGVAAVTVNVLLPGVIPA